MVGLLADGWFYISSAGLLVSGVLFFFLLSQYRAANDAADHSELEASSEAHPVVRPLSILEGSPAAATVASVAHEKPVENMAQAAEKAPEPAATPVEKRRENTTGGINPAVVYLQNIKNQLEEMQNENRELAKRVEAITNRDEALIERLSELAQAIAEIKSAGPAAAAAQAPVEPVPAEPAPKRAKKIPAPAPEPVVVVESAPAPEPSPAPETPPILVIEPTTSSGVAARKPAPTTEPTAETLFSPDETARLTLKPVEAAAQAAAPAEPKPAASEPVEEPESEKHRRGPVWPV